MARSLATVLAPIPLVIFHNPSTDDVISMYVKQRMTWGKLQTDSASKCFERHSVARSKDNRIRKC